MHKRAQYALVLLGVIVIALLALQTPLLRYARDASWSAWTRSVGRLFAVGPLTVPNNVEEQLTRLTAENARLRAEVADYARLREQIGSRSFEGFEAVQAEIAVQPLDVFRSHYVINRGAADGILLGAPAVVYESTLVGFVHELHEHTAVVQLIPHPSTSFPAELLQGESASRGLVRGKAFTSIEMVTIPRDVTLEIGQEVVTVAHEQLVPQGLLAGRVTSLRDEEHEPYQEVGLELLYDAEDLRAVTILVPL